MPLQHKGLILENKRKRFNVTFGIGFVCIVNQIDLRGDLKDPTMTF